MAELDNHNQINNMQTNIELAFLVFNLKKKELQNIPFKGFTLR